MDWAINSAEAGAPDHFETGCRCSTCAARADYDEASGTGTVTTAATLPVWTADQIANYLAYDFWAGGWHSFGVRAGGSLPVNLGALPGTAQFLVREALALWSDVTGIIFNEVASGEKLLFTDTDTGAYCSVSYSGNETLSAKVNVSTDWLARYGTGLNTYSFQTYLHEIGHALGLGHAGNYNGSASYGTHALYANDSWAATLMSYFSQTQNTYTAGLGYTRQFVLTPTVADALATTALYGAPIAVRTGDTRYGFGNTSGRAVYDATQNVSLSYTIFDGGGVDTLDYSGFSAVQRIDLNAESVSNVGGRRGNVTIARGALIENAVGGSGADTLIGNALDNVLDGGAGADVFRLEAGGNDVVRGGSGDDGFLFGGAFSAADDVDGGAGSLDQVGLQGDYGGLTLGANSLVGIELLVFLSGTDTRFGGSGTMLHSYAVTTIDANVAAGARLVVTFNTLKAGENVTFNGAAESDGSFLTYGGNGVDVLTGGQSDDGFYFGTDRRFDPGDRIDGRGGSLDQLGLQGQYAGATALVLGADTIRNVEMIVVLSAVDSRFGAAAAGGYGYDITTHDANVAMGGRLVLSANSLTAGETVRFDGAAETDGNFLMYGGAGGDTLIGGAGDDELWGRGGADAMHGGGGFDRFVYTAAADSAGGASDHILDLMLGDLIDLSRIDAIAGGADDTFAMIDGAAAFTAAGQLRVRFDGASWIIEGEVNGDGVADLVISVTAADLTPLGIAHLVL